ncbi:IST1 homolog isoform X4 [Heterocephalus glaber]|uniref:IST1 homolog n=1 Tax=Heterocephalus glaber TaxID=10181 RepID=A0AAX6SVJ1_HETGA|nr:IST1 homolog isoform X4 [Heterocephalus glaber]
MFSSAFKVDRLRVNLQLVINRLKLLEKKKTEQTQKARKEIADFLAAGKDERARIQVEHIIREDYLVEAMEILELYCDLLLARINLIRATKELDSGLAESVSTLIWAAPRLQSEVPELKIAEALEDLVNIGFTKDVKKNPLGRGGGTAVGTGDPPEASPIPTPGPSPLPSPGPCVLPLPPRRQNDDYKNTLLPSVVPSPGLNPQTSPQPESRAKIGFRNSVLPDLPDVKPHTSRSIDTYDSEEVDFEDLNRRLEMLKKMT